jgi:NAD/NADP transhydrogenase beta subunit
MTQGESRLEAAYAGRTLSAVLPPEVAVPAAVAAMEQTFRSRGYSIEKSTATGELGVVIARPPRTTTIPEVEAIITSVVGGTRIAITNKPWGDEALGRSLLDGVLQRLGL